MTPITETDPVSTTIATVTVRIPRDSEASLEVDIQRRLSRLEGLDSVTVEGFQDIDPRFPVIVATATVTIDSPLSVEELGERVTQSASVDGFEGPESVVS